VHNPAHRPFSHYDPDGEFCPDEWWGTESWWQNNGLITSHRLNDTSHYYRPTHLHWAHNDNSWPFYTNSSTSF